MSKRLLNRLKNVFVHTRFKQSVMITFACVLSIGALLAVERFEIRHAQTSIVDGVYVLSTEINYSLHPEAEEILQKGLAIKFIVQTELFQERKYWRDKKIAYAQQIFYLQKNAITEKYVLSSPNVEEQKYFSSAADAISNLGDFTTIELIESQQISDPKKIQARTRLVIDVRHFSGTVNYLAKYWDDWRIVSEWYEWPLKL